MVYTIIVDNDEIKMYRLVVSATELQAKKYGLVVSATELQFIFFGLVAQLGERCVRNAEVGSSNLLRSI